MLGEKTRASWEQCAVYDDEIIAYILLVPPHAALARFVICRHEVTKGLQENLRSHELPKLEQNSHHEARKLLSVPRLNCEQKANPKMKTNIREQICKLSPPPAEQQQHNRGQKL